MRPENKAMTGFLALNGFFRVAVKYISSGSMKGCWRFYDKNCGWNQEVQERLEDLGFRGFDGCPLNQFSGNGGRFSVFVRGHEGLAWVASIVEELRRGKDPLRAEHERVISHLLDGDIEGALNVCPQETYSWLKHELGE